MSRFLPCGRAFRRFFSVATLWDEIFLFMEMVEWLLLAVGGFCAGFWPGRVCLCGGREMRWHFEKYDWSPVFQILIFKTSYVDNYL